jgi:hypothetical protein
MFTLSFEIGLHIIITYQKNIYNVYMEISLYKANFHEVTNFRLPHLAIFIDAFSTLFMKNKKRNSNIDIPTRILEEVDLSL